MRPHQGTPAVNSQEADQTLGFEGQSEGLKSGDSSTDLVTSPEVEEKQFTNEAGWCLIYNSLIIFQVFSILLIVKVYLSIKVDI